MDKKFLNKVVDQLVSETRIDHDQNDDDIIYTPFTSSGVYKSFLYRELGTIGFYNHCRGIYGLEVLEIRYVWSEYKKIIRDEIRSLH
jgi:hypothetical protein